MRATRTTFIAALVVLLWGIDAPAANAQVFGTFTWQMQPFCNRVTMTLTAAPGGFTLHGYDDQCGAAKRASAYGMAVFNPDGTVAVNFTVVASPGASPAHVSGSVSPANGQGTWSDHAGNLGTFALFGASAGLPPRPAATAPVDVADNPNGPSSPCASAPAEVMVLCGAGASRWLNAAGGFPGLQVWRDHQGYVHVRGSVQRPPGPLTGVLFYLPPGLRPTRVLMLSAVTAPLGAGAYQSGTVSLLVYSRDFAAVPSLAGAIVVAGPSDAAHTVIHLGELVFRVDQ